MIKLLFLSPIISYYMTTIRDNAVKEKGFACSSVYNWLILHSNYVLPFPFTALSYLNLREIYMMFVIRLIIICSTLSLLTSMAAVPVIPPMS